MLNKTIVLDFHEGFFKNLRLTTADNLFFTKRYNNLLELILTLFDTCVLFFQKLLRFADDIRQHFRNDRFARIDRIIG